MSLEEIENSVVELREVHKVHVETDEDAPPWCTTRVHE